MKFKYLVLMAALGSWGQLATAQEGGMCDKRAVSIVKAVIRADHGAQIASEADYRIERSEIAKETVKGKARWKAKVEITAFQLDGEDSDTAEVYELTFRTSATSHECSTLESLVLTDEN